MSVLYILFEVVLEILANNRNDTDMAAYLSFPANQFCVSLFVCFLWRCGPMRAMASSFLRFLDHTQRRITVGRTPLDE
jgi:hypothetical protein